MVKDATVNNKTNRIIAMIRALPRKGYITKKVLHKMLVNEGYNVDVRSVERDLQELSASQELGSFIRCDDSRKEYRWSIDPKARLFIPAMDREMAATWDLVHRYLKPLMGRDILERLEPEFQEAKKWFERHAPKGKRHWSDKVAYLPTGFLLKPAEVNGGIVDEIYRALHENRQMEVWYKEKNKPDLVHPYALVDRGAMRYLVVRYWNYETTRHLALSRIRKVRVQDEAAKGANEFNLDGYLREGSMNLPYGMTINLVLLFSREAGGHLYETPVNDSQKLSSGKDGKIKMTVTVEMTEELKWWILGFGGEVEVLSPKSLRADVAGKIAKAHVLYAS